MQTMNKGTDFLKMSLLLQSQVPCSFQMTYYRVPIHRVRTKRNFDPHPHSPQGKKSMYFSYKT